MYNKRQKKKNASNANNEQPNTMEQGSQIPWNNFRPKTNIQITHQEINKKGRQLMGKLYKMINKKAQMIREHKLRRIESIIILTMIYGREIWNTTTEQI